MRYPAASLTDVGVGHPLDQGSVFRLVLDQGGRFQSTIVAILEKMQLAFDHFHFRTGGLSSLVARLIQLLIALLVHEGLDGGLGHESGCCA